ncbi:MipA/OmpV family protein [Enterobacter sp. CC120223-11]|uniref:MipA/OmpV family protein n=1 Tax=Enterobacter sp. CC120223-11 TaxID=1378073 RepID=UPI000BC9429A|nr:MipA/OmpV family protein [Enterobacter sp. CC120223-11]SNY61055.1 Outer membrane scaffolding protein for murein synthesis, MipA/OmpV family [Enterobacter sp. CC120223-11]
MLQIAFLLAGASFVRKAAPVLLLVGLLWGGLGASIFVDGLQGERHFPLHIFGLLLLADSIVSLLMGSAATGTQRGVFCFKGGLFLLIALLILSGQHSGNLVLAIIFGMAYFITGLFVIASAIVVRFKHWQFSLLSGFLQLVFAIFLFLPFPTQHDGTVSQFIGMVLIVGGIQWVRLSVRMFRIKQGRSVFDILAPDDLLETRPVTPPVSTTIMGSGPLVVHVWTPEGSAEEETLPRPVINRYIAAVDAHGVISTGHAALELSPSLYISLYPAADIDRSPSEFFNTLKAVEANTVAGTFQPDYFTEAKNWCESDRKILFSTFNAESLQSFWARYRQTETYNLTWRNCSSSVAYALEAALDGVLRERCSWGGFLRLFFIPELWIAAQIRKRATTMAWTPGLLLDYTRTLHAIVHPARISILSFIRRTIFSGLLAVGLIAALMPHPAAAVALGLEGGSYGTPYDDRRAENWVLPYIGYDYQQFYIDGTEMGYKLVDDEVNSLKLKVWYLDVQYDASEGRTAALRKLNNRHSTMLAGASYLRTTPVGGFQTTVGVDTLNQSQGVTANFSWILMKQWGGLTVLPIAGVDWNNSQQNRYYYGISEEEASRSGLSAWRPHASMIPFVSLAANYDWHNGLNTWAEMTGRFYSSTITDSPMINKDAIAELTLGFSYGF